MKGLGFQSKPFLFENDRTPLWDAECSRELPMLHDDALESGNLEWKTSQLAGINSCGLA